MSGSDGIVKMRMSNFLKIGMKSVTLQYNERDDKEFYRVDKIYGRAMAANSGVTVEVSGHSPNKSLTLRGTPAAIQAVLTVRRSPYRSPPRPTNRRTIKKAPTIPGGIATRRTSNRRRSTSS